MLFFLRKPQWRNWQTRYVQGVVGIELVGVQVPPAAQKRLI